MQEIQERKEPYRMNGDDYRWRDGELQAAMTTGYWAKSGFHGPFIAGEVFPLDPLTGEFVCPPKTERPYDLTTGQMIDAIQEGEKWECDQGQVSLDSSGFITWNRSGSRLAMAVSARTLRWRKVED